MKVSLSFNSSSSEDVAIMVDVLRASTTINVAMGNFKEIIPVKGIEEAQILAKSKNNSVLAGERRGSAIEGFVITTSNGTRIMEGINAKILIGSFVNAKAVAREALNLADSHIDIVMAGVEGRFAIEDFLGAGEIISNLKDHKLDEKALAACMASVNNSMVDNAVKNSRSARRLAEIGLSKDVDFCLKRNIYDHVPVYVNGSITGKKE